MGDETKVRLGGRDWPRIPYGRESDARRDVALHVCRDCGVSEGEFHVTGCVVEQCPACGLQLLMCHGLERHEEKGSGAWDGHPWAGDALGPPPSSGE